MHPKRRSSPTRKSTIDIVGFVSMVFVLLLLFEVPLALALRAEAYLTAQVIVGASIAGLVLQRRLNFSEFIGLGFALGSFVAMCIDQLLIQTPLASVSWVFIPTAAIIGLLTKYKYKHMLQEHSHPLPSLLFVAFLVLVILVQERYWPLYIALSLLPLLIFNSYSSRNLSSTQKWIIRSVLASFVLITGLSVIRNRPNLWWIKTQDFQFFEALSYSLTHWGSNDQIFVQGQPVLYHWFSYAWMGLTTKAISAPTWVVQTKIAPVIVAVVIVYLVIALLQSLKVGGWRLVTILMVVVLINDFNFESFSMVFSYIWILAFAFFLFQWCKIQNWHLAIASSVMAAGALGAKSSNIAILVSGFGMLLAFELIQKRIHLKKVVVHASVFIIAMALVYLKLYFNSPYSATIKFGTVGIAQDFFGDVDTLQRGQFTFWSIVVLSNILALYLASMFATRTERSTEFRSLWLFCLGSLLATISALLVSVSIYEQEEYFLHSFVLFGSIITGLATCRFIEHFGNKQESRRNATILFALLISVIFIRLYINDDNSGEAWAIRARIINGSSVLVLVLSALLIYIFTKRSKISIQNIIALFIVSALLVTVVSLNGTWFKHQGRFRNEILSLGFSANMIGTVEMQKFFAEAQRFIPRDAIVASNYVCDAIDCPVSTYDADRKDWTVGGEAMVLTIYLHRRLYVSGYGYLWQNVELPTFARDRLRLSIDFGTFQTESLAKRLIDDGVEYFVLDRKSKVGTLSNRYAESLLTSQRFELLRLIDSN